MDSTVAPGRVFRFGQFEARADTGQLFKQGREVKLQEQPFRLLVALLEGHGRVVSRQRLKEALWPNGLVEFDKSLDVAMAKLRQALDDDSSSPRFIATVPRRGYQFIAPLALSDAASPDGHSPALVQGNTTTLPRRGFAALSLIALAAIAAAAIGVWQWQVRHVAPPLAARALVLIEDFANSTGDVELRSLASHCRRYRVRAVALSNGSVGRQGRRGAAGLGAPAR